jgi:hypothetical protein
MDAQSSSRALGAARDLLELLQLAQSAAERAAQEVYGAAFEHAELIEREVARVRRSAEKLARDIEDYVGREEGESAARGHPLRRASDRHF